MRGCGIIMHISSLAGAGGIGSMGKEAFEFVDFLKAAGQTHWQILPLNPPACENSPYSSCSVFAGNPYFINFEILVEQKLLTEQDIEILPQESKSQADFESCQELNSKLLHIAYKNLTSEYAEKIKDFRGQNSNWLEDYALFMALKTENKNIHYHKWPQPILFRQAKAIEEAKKRLADEIDFWVFVQYIFAGQWKKLKAYANKNGIKIVGDMPIYAAGDSADVWANPKVFQLDKNLMPKAVAGVPPDFFSDDGQLWGNPIYDWNYLKKTDFDWWIKRMAKAAELYDVVRIDHFRAIDTYYSIPADAETARVGTWKKGPNLAFVDAVREKLPKLQLIAEDLGDLAPSVHTLMRESGLPGMKVLIFAFDPADKEPQFMPHNYTKNCVAYIGTHDNDTVQGWMKEAPKANVKLASEYLQFNKNNAHWGFIRGLYASVADLAIVQMQDFLGLDNSARMNMPGIAKGWWGFRVAPDALTPKLASKIAKLARTYHRSPKKTVKE